MNCDACVAIPFYAVETVQFSMIRDVLVPVRHFPFSFLSLGWCRFFGPLDFSLA